MSYFGGTYTGFTGFQNSVFNTPYINGFQQPNFLPTQVGLSSQLFSEAVKEATNTGDQKWKKILDTVLEYGGKALTLLVNSGVIRSKSDLYNGSYSQQGFNDFYGGTGYSGLGNDPGNQGGFLQQNQNLLIGVAIVVLVFIGLRQKDKK